MKNRVFVGLFLSMVACVGLYAVSGCGPEAVPAQAAQNMLGTATLEATHTQFPQATETPFYTPTLNYSATDAQKGLEAAQAVLQAANVAATAQVEAAGIIATSQYQSDQSAQTTIKIQAFAQSTKDAASNEAAGIEVERIQAENEAARIAQDEWRIGAQYLTGGGIFLIGLGLCAWLAWAWVARDRSEDVSETEEVTENELDRPVVQMAQRAATNYPAVEQMDGESVKILTDAAFRLSLLMDAPISNRKQNLIGKAELVRVRTVLTNHGYAVETTDGLIINKNGMDEITKLLPHATDKPIEAGNPAGVTHHTTPQNSRGSGRLFPKLK